MVLYEEILSMQSILFWEGILIFIFCVGVCYVLWNLNKRLMKLELKKGD